MPKNIHTVPRGENWAVKKEGQAKPLSVHNTKARALERGAAAAKKLHVEHIIHGRDGQIKDRDSYGRDPNPPKDKKH